MWELLGGIVLGVIVSISLLYLGFRLGWKVRDVVGSQTPTEPLPVVARFNPGNPLDPISVEQQSDAVKARRQIADKIRALQERDS